MSKFVIEPNMIYDVNFCSYSPFVFDDSLEADEEEEYEEA